MKIKFSIIVPVYNTEKYLSKNIESIINQSYENFEAIFINDGSKDKSLSIIEKYVKKDKRIKVIDKGNSGVSDSRNIGIEKSSGDYLCFIDSDDYIEIDFLKKLYEVIISDKNPDLVRTSYNKVDESYVVLEEKKNYEIHNKDGIDSFKYFIDNSDMIDIPWIFIYNKKYWDKNNYKFLVGTFHEDFGLIPEVLIKSKKVSTSNAIYYYLINRKGSTMSTVNKEFIYKKANDVLINYDRLTEKVLNSCILTNKEKSIFKHYIDNAVIEKLNMLDGKEYVEYKKKLIKRKIFNICDSNIKIIIKKIILNISLKLYSRIVR